MSERGMRRRWHWPMLEGVRVDAAFVVVGIFVWVFGWLILLCLAMAIYSGIAGTHAQEFPWIPGRALLILSLLPLPPAVLWGCKRLLAWLWKMRPRRVTAPVLTDLREADRSSPFFGVGGEG